MPALTASDESTGFPLLASLRLNGLVLVPFPFDSEVMTAQVVTAGSGEAECFLSVWAGARPEAKVASDITHATKTIALTSTTNVREISMVLWNIN